MPVFLEVRSGPQAGNRIRLEQGTILRVGRAAQADLAFSEDTHMSSLHFSLGWDGPDCRVADLNSRNGIRVNGEPATATVVGDGDSIVAGETAFLIRIQPEEPVTVASSAAALAFPEVVITPQDRLLPLLRRDLQPLFAILDSARDVRIPAFLLHYLAYYKGECQSLDEGPESGEPEHVPPYLVRLAPDSKLLEALVREGWGKSWGVYFTCAGEFQEIRSHLRRFLQAKLPSGEQVNFRFYDPRVLRIFLPTCAAEDATQFFGPIQRYVMEGEEPDQLWEFTTAGRGAEKRVLSLGQPAFQDPKAMSATAPSE